jgi:uncharacterized membrane protein
MFGHTMRSGYHHAGSVLRKMTLFLSMMLGVSALAMFRAHRKSSPTDILNRRYARGEVNQEEYDRIKKNLAG